MNMDNETKEYYNCVIDCSFGGWNGKVSTTSIIAENCLFNTSSNSYYSGSNAIYGTAINCASTNTSIEPYKGTKTTCLTNVNTDKYYNIISSGWKNTGTGTNPDGTQSNIGVYGGRFAWKEAPIEYTLDRNNNRIELSLKEEISKLSYVYGNAISETNIEFHNNAAQITISKNGAYTIYGTTIDGLEFTKMIIAENFNLPQRYTINNEQFIFERLVTVGNGGEVSTIKEAFDILYDYGYKTNGGILLLEGSYSTSGIQTGTSSNIDKKYDKMSICIIGDKPGKVILSPGETGMSENGAQYGITLKFYRIVFRNSNGTFHMNMDNEAKEYYNCIIDCSFGGWNGKVSTAAIHIENCVFKASKNSYHTSSPISGMAINCASTTEYIEPYNGTKTTCLTSISIDSNYNLTSGSWQNNGTGTNPDGTQANIGVYGGKYSW